MRTAVTKRRQHSLPINSKHNWNNCFKRGLDKRPPNLNRTNTTSCNPMTSTKVFFLSTIFWPRRNANNSSIWPRPWGMHKPTNKKRVFRRIEGMVEFNALLPKSPLNCSNVADICFLRAKTPCNLLGCPRIFDFTNTNRAIVSACMSMTATKWKKVSLVLRCWCTWTKTSRGVPLNFISEAIQRKQGWSWRFNRKKAEHSPMNIFHTVCCMRGVKSSKESNIWCGQTWFSVDIVLLLKLKEIKCLFLIYYIYRLRWILGKSTDTIWQLEERLHAACATFSNVTWFKVVVNFVHTPTVILQNLLLYMYCCTREFCFKPCSTVLKFSIPYVSLFSELIDLLRRFLSPSLPPILRLSNRRIPHCNEWFQCPTRTPIFCRSF